MPKKPSIPPPPLAPRRAAAAHVQASVVRTAQARMPDRRLPSPQATVQRANEEEKPPWPPGAEGASNYRAMSDKGYGSANRFRGFSTNQIDLIIAYNKKRNGGKLKSDASNDPCPDLVEDESSEARPEVDHIVSKNSGGSNHYLNARVVSWKLNNGVEREAHWSTKKWHS